MAGGRDGRDVATGAIEHPRTRVTRKWTERPLDRDGVPEAHSRLLMLDGGAMMRVWIQSVCVIACGSQFAVAQMLERVSLGLGGGQGNHDSFRPALSADGRPDNFARLPLSCRSA